MGNFSTCHYSFFVNSDSTEFSPRRFCERPPQNGLFSCIFKGSLAKISQNYQTRFLNSRTLTDQDHFLFIGTADRAGPHLLTYIDHDFCLRDVG